MSRQYKNGRCSCWKKINDNLFKLDENTALVIVFTMNGHEYLRLDTKVPYGCKKTPKTVLASYCPFCGKKLKEPKK